VDHSLRFIAVELTGRRALRTYRVRKTRGWLCLQHNTPDVLVLDEIFYQRLYEPPREVERVLPMPLRALDGGANIGMFGVWLLGRYPVSELLSFEPDVRNAQLLRRTIEANDAQRTWRMMEAAVGTAPGTVGFAGSDFATSHVVDNPDAPRVPAVDFFEHARNADLVKLDIEGSEWEILSDPRMADLPARAVVLEYHPERFGRGDTHDAARALLERAGFTTMPIFKAPTGVGMVWAWRPLSRLDRKDLPG